jgi:class 3 adenylate cyclase/tetratricopeptide (TPR) repeat protein
MSLALTRNELFAPYVPRLVRSWLADTPEQTSREIEGTAVFVDVSGFTKLSERLSRRGKIGAEELAATINECFASLLAIAWNDGGILLKFGGDALLLFFTGPEHELAAAHAAVAMRQELRDRRGAHTSAGFVPLRMSVGLHTGNFNFFLLGTVHRELVISGPAATATVTMENIASAGEILLSEPIARRLPDRAVGGPKGDGYRLRQAPVSDNPRAPVVSTPEPDTDIGAAIPVAIREHLVGGGDEPEHRHVTVAFIHFEDVDDMIRDGGPAETAAALDSLVTDAQVAAIEHGITFLGTDIDRDGGKIILVAGAPASSADDEERMLGALRLIADRDRRLPVRIGVNSGRVFAGDIGATFRRTFTVMGDTVNLAARLMAAAPHGQILATNATLERSRTTFRSTPLPPFKVKGKSRPVQAFSVAEAVASAQSDTRVSAPLVGRSSEMRTLRRRLDDARASHGSVIEISGEAGVGKSRLAWELGADADDVTIVSVRCSLYESHTPYAAFRPILRLVLGAHTDDSPHVMAQRLRDRVEAEAWEFVDWLPLLGVPLDLAFPETTMTRALDDRFRRTKTEEVVVEFLSYALPTPTLLVFEDAHWMDESSDSLLRRLATAVETRSWLVCIVRGDRGQPPLDDANTTLLRLAPLDTEESTALAGAVTEEHPLPPHQIDEVVQRAGGNPLFLLTMLDAARTTLVGEELPTTVEAVMAASIDLLEPSDRRLLREAAVLGSEFPGDLLETVVSQADVSARLTRGALAEFVRRDDAGVLHFHHALARDVAYEGLPYRRRREMHQRVGELIEQGSQSADDDAELLSLHFLSAEDHRKAWHYSCLAGDRANAKYATIDAARFYERALEAARKLGDVPAPDVARVAETLGEARDRAGLYEAASAAFRRCRQLLADDPVAQGRLALKEAWLAERLGRYTQAVRWIRRGDRALAGAPGQEAMAQRAKLAAWYAAIRQAQGRYSEAARWSQESIRMAQEAGDGEALAQAYVILDAALIDLGRSSEAQYSPKALAIYEELGDLHGQALVLNMLGASAYDEGRWDEALTLYEDSRALRERAGAAADAAYATWNIAETLNNQGHFAEAASLLRKARLIWRAAGDPFGVAMAESLLGSVVTRAGDPASGHEMLERARATFEDLGSEPEARAAEAGIAECLLALGLPSASASVAGAALDRAAQSRLAPTLHRVRGRALACLGDREAGTTELLQGLRAARADSNDFEVAVTLAALAEVGADDGADENDRLAAESQEILNRLGVVALPWTLEVRDPGVAVI